MKDDDLPEVFRNMAPWQRFWLLGLPKIACYVTWTMALCLIVAGVIELMKHLLGS